MILWKLENCVGYNVRIHKSGELLWKMNLIIDDSWSAVRSLVKSFVSFAICHWNHLVQV